MSNLKLQTKAEYIATIKELRAEAERLDNQPVGNAHQAREIGQTIALLQRRADTMERAMLTDGTLQADFQMAERQRREEIEAARFQTAMNLDRRVNPQRYVTREQAAEYLNNSVDLFSGLDQSQKVSFISQLLGGQATGKDVDGNLYISHETGRATLHNDGAGSYVSFIGKGE